MLLPRKFVYFAAYAFCRINYQYEVNLATSTQCNITTGTQRRVRRVPARGEDPPLYAEAVAAYQEQVKAHRAAIAAALKPPDLAAVFLVRGLPAHWCPGVPGSAGTSAGAGAGAAGAGSPGSGAARAGAGSGAGAAGSGAGAATCSGAGTSAGASAGSSDDIVAGRHRVHLARCVRS
jgi:hypothetical protein